MAHSWAFEWNSTGGSDTAGDLPASGSAAPRVVHPGDVFAGYEIVATLGKGGMGTVFRARDQRANREVALKVLHEKANPAHLERLRREGELTAALDHPGIVKVHAGGDVDGRPYLAYALVEGARPLDHAWKELDREARVALLRDTARAVGHAHQHGVVHRDLKGENVLVGAANTPRVVDFGLARHADHEGLTESGAIMGTPLGMAPEQFAAQHERVGPGTDVFALGVLLYQALTDQRPFAGRSWVELAAAVAEGEVEPPRAHDRTIPAALEAVCLRCLAVEPSERYAHGDALADDLQAALEGRPISSASAWFRVRRRARRVGPLLVGACLLGAAVLGGSLYAQAHWSRANREGELRRLAAEVEREGTPRQRQDLDDLLATNQDLPASARAAALLALAGDRPNDVAAWRERLDYARRAAALNPGRAGEANRRAGECLLALEHHAEAAEALALALDATPSDGVRVLLARAHLLNGDAVAAESALGDTEATPLRARAIFAQGRQDEARALAARYAETRQDVETKVLLAELEFGRGDVDGLLRELIRAHPRHPEPRRALVRHLLQLGSPGIAAGVLRKEPGQLAATLNFLTCAAIDRERAPDAATRAMGWRRPTVRASLLAARRELAYRNAAWPAERFRGYAERTRSLLDLVRALIHPSWRAEVAQLEGLEQELTADPEERSLTFEQRREAEAWFERIHVQQRLRGLSPPELETAYREVYDTYPRFHKARFYFGKAMLVQGKAREGLPEILGAISNEPILFRQLHSDSYKRRAGFGQFFSGGSTGSAADEVSGLVTAFNHAVAVEQEEASERAVPALVLLDQVLDEQPGNVLARTLRGFILTRLKRLERAEQDLNLAVHAQPGCAVTAFYRFLLLAAQGHDPALLRQELRRTQGLGFFSWRQPTWNAGIYPEIAHVLGEPGFEILGGH